MTIRIGNDSWSRKHSQYIDATIEILQHSKDGRSIRELVDIMLLQNLITKRGKTPDKTLYAQIARIEKRRAERGLDPLFNKTSVNGHPFYSLYKK